MIRGWIVWYMILVHLAWGLTTLMDAEGMGATPVASIARFFGHNHTLTGLVLIASSCCAMGAIISGGDRPTIWQAVLFLPQQWLTGMTALGALHAVIHQAYADGVQRPWAFIFNDQFPAMAAMLVYTIALAAWFGGLITWNSTRYR